MFTPTALEIQNLSMVFGVGTEAVIALSDVSFSIYENEFFTLLGPSGCGKTTLLRLIAGFEQPSNGSILLYGQRLEGLPPFARPVNTVFQSYALFPHLSVAQNIAFGLEMQGKSKHETAKKVAEMLELVQLPHLANRKPAQLSGGQQQRVALARALANQPKVLLLDESLSALDAKLRKEMQLELKRLQFQTGITFVFVTHDQEEALTMSNRIAVMKHGKLEQIGTPTEIYDAPHSRYVADFIGETNFLSGVFEVGGVRLPDGQWLEVNHQKPVGSSADLAIRPERIGLVTPERIGLVTPGRIGLVTPGRIGLARSSLQAVVRDLVYIGADTLVYLEFGGTLNKLRLQNSGGAQNSVQLGETVQLQIAPEAVRILKGGA